MVGFPLCLIPLGFQFTDDACESDTYTVKCLVAYVRVVIVAAVRVPESTVFVLDDNRAWVIYQFCGATQRGNGNKNPYPILWLVCNLHRTVYRKHPLGVRLVVGDHVIVHDMYFVVHVGASRDTEIGSSEMRGTAFEVMAS